MKQSQYIVASKKSMRPGIEFGIYMTCCFNYVRSAMYFLYFWHQPRFLIIICNLVKKSAGRRNQSKFPAPGSMQHSYTQSSHFLQSVIDAVRILPVPYLCYCNSTRLCRHHSGADRISQSLICSVSARPCHCRNLTWHS